MVPALVMVVLMVLVLVTVLVLVMVVLMVLVQPALLVADNQSRSQRQHWWLLESKTRRVRIMSCQNIRLPLDHDTLTGFGEWVNKFVSLNPQGVMQLLLLLLLVIAFKIEVGGYIVCHIVCWWRVWVCVFVYRFWCLRAFLFVLFFIFPFFFFLLFFQRGSSRSWSYVPISCFARWGAESMIHRRAGRESEEKGWLAGNAAPDIADDAQPIQPGRSARLIAPPMPIMSVGASGSPCVGPKALCSLLRMNLDSWDGG